jgi:hypothetical protein
MKNLQDATEKICDLKGSILALDTLVGAIAYALPLDARAELQRRVEAHAEVARTVLLQSEISDHTIAAFERDIERAMSLIKSSQRLPQPSPPHQGEQHV